MRTEVLEQIQQGVGMIRAADCAAVFGYSTGSWWRLVKTGKISPGILLSSRNRSWPASYIKGLLEQMEAGLWPSRHDKEETPVSADKVAAFAKIGAIQRGKRAK